VLGRHGDADLALAEVALRLRGTSAVAAVGRLRPLEGHREHLDISAGVDAHGGHSYPSRPPSGACWWVGHPLPALAATLLVAAAAAPLRSTGSAASLHSHHCTLDAQTVTSSLVGCTLPDWWAGRMLFGSPARTYGSPVAGGHSWDVETPSAAVRAGGSVPRRTKQACWLPWIRPYTPDGGELGRAERWVPCGGGSGSWRL